MYWGLFSQFLKLRTVDDAEQNLTIFGKFFSIRYFNSVHLAYAASQNWCEQMQWQWRTKPIFLGKKNTKKQDLTSLLYIFVDSWRPRVARSFLQIIITYKILY